MSLRGGVDLEVEDVSLHLVLPGLVLSDVELAVIAGTGLGWVEDGETLRPQDISYGPHGQQSTTSFPSPPPLPPHCLIKNI